MLKGAKGYGGSIPELNETPFVTSLFTFAIPAKKPPTVFDPLISLT
jgi:hypothetical protein